MNVPSAYRCFHKKENVVRETKKNDDDRNIIKPVLDLRPGYCPRDKSTQNE